MSDNILNSGKESLLWECHPTVHLLCLPLHLLLAYHIFWMQVLSEMKEIIQGSPW